MGQRADGKYGGVDGESYTKFGEKTSEYGHWEVGASFAGTNPNGEKWQNQRMEWVEDNRSFSAPDDSTTDKPMQDEQGDRNAEDIVQSPEIQQSKERVGKYKSDDLSGKTSQSIYGGLKSDYRTLHNTPANDPQELLESYKQGLTANNSTEIEKVGSNLNTDLINSIETTHNNQFGSKTFSAVPIADKAAQNFFTDKKQLVLKSFK